MDHDKLFVSRFWKELYKITGVKLKISFTYHPETDRVIEQTNKTINQMLHFHVNH